MFVLNVINVWKSVLYCQELTRLQEAIQKKRPELVNRKGVVFHHDNARPHASFMTRQKLTELGWEVLMHPPYSPDLAPSDYHFLRSLQNFLGEKNWPTKEQPKTMSPSFSSRNHRSSILMKLWNYPKNGRRSRLIMAHMFLYKIDFQ